MQQPAQEVQPPGPPAEDQRLADAVAATQQMQQTIEGLRDQVAQMKAREDMVKKRLAKV